MTRRWSHARAREVRTRRRRRTDGRSFLSFSRTDVRDDDVRDDDDDDAFVEPMRAPRARSPRRRFPKTSARDESGIGATIVGDGDEERVLGRGARRGGWDRAIAVAPLEDEPSHLDLRLYDLQGTPGVAADLSHTNTTCQVRGFAGAEQLEDALRGADLVIIPAGVPRKPGMTRDDLFAINAASRRDLCEGAPTLRARTRW